jgi:exopolysaccharide production protein ExoY
MQQHQSWPTLTLKWVPGGTQTCVGNLESLSPTAAALAAERIPVWKRLTDLALILVALPFVLLISGLMALYIKLVSPGPVFFTQERIGFRCKRFNLFKFRTMHVGADVGGHKNHVDDLICAGDKPMNKMDHNDSRLIPMGKWIRASGLDELPQLFNVLLGDMSVVGPRPCTEYEYQRYKNWQKERFNAVPGLTGLWQVSGKNSTTFNEMINLDIAYAREQSLWLDVRIIARTFGVLYRQVAEARTPAQAPVREAAPATRAFTAVASTTTTSNNSTGGYEKRVESRSSGVRILGT